jgi:glycerophosphoryl diester phosphodiesterase
LVDDFGQQTSYKIPTFAEALNWGKSKPIYFMVDIKKGVDYRDIVKTIEQANMQKQVVLVTYTVGQAKKVASTCARYVIVCFDAKRTRI